MLALALTIALSTSSDALSHVSNPGHTPIPNPKTLTLTLQLCFGRRRVLPSSAEKREASQLYGAVVDETFPHGTLDTKFWSFPGVTGLKVRGHNYLQAREPPTVWL